MKAITEFSQLDLSKKYTYADYILWQFHERVELIKGMVVKMSPAPKRRHQEISSFINNYLIKSLERSACKVYYAPFDVRLIKNKGVGDKEIDTVVQPDICVVCDLSKLDENGCIGAPDLIVEILSPGNKKHDEVNKFNLYEANCVREYWLVDPEAMTVKIYTLKNEKFELVDYYEKPGLMIPINIFNGLEMSYDELFKE